MASYREGRLRSIAWEHFEIKDRERGVATCNICHVAFSYRTSVSNLMKHLKNKHGYVIIKGENDEEGAGESENESLSEKGNSKPKIIKTELWEYYQVKDEENKLATCTMCLDQFSYQDSTANLYKHLQAKHSIDFGKVSGDDQENDDDDERGKVDDEVSTHHLNESKGRKMSSVAWEYFEIKDDTRRVASCNICGALCSFKTSVSNLMKHARRRHGVAGGPDDYDDGRPEETISQDSAEDIPLKESKVDTSSSRSQRSIVWLYFKPVENNESKLSQCLICNKTLSHSSTLTNLKKHLARKHPNVKIPQREDGRKRILLSSGGELYEVETETYDEDNDNDNSQQDVMAMDTVFLEDFDLQDDEPLRKPKQSTSKKRKYSSSSEEEITFINRYVKKPSDSFDHFGKYIASLLRNLPKEMSSKLQADFVKQITNAEKESSSCSQEFLPDVK